MAAQVVLHAEARLQWTAFSMLESYITSPLRLGNERLPYLRSLKAARVFWPSWMALSLLLWTSLALGFAAVVSLSTLS